MSLVVSRASGSVDSSELNAYIANPVGPIRTDIRRRARNVQLAVLPRIPRRTGRLASTLRVDEGFEGAGRPYVDVIVGIDGVTDYLGYILNGTPPHVITPHEDRPNPHLRFLSGGGVVFAKSVNHPGTRANDFLTPALPQALR